MKSPILLLLCAPVLLAQQPEQAHAAAPAKTIASQAALSPAEAIARLKERGIINPDSPALGKLSRELLEHFARYEAGQEHLGDYPYIDTLLALYERAVAGDWAKLPPRDLRAFAAAGCRIRNLAECCRCATAAGAPDKNLLRCVLQLGEQLPPESLRSADAGGHTPLMYAVRYGLPAEVAQSLICRGSEVNATTTTGRTPLMYAAALSDEEPEAAALLGILLEAGAAVNAIAADEWTPLMLAAHTGQLGALSTLINKGADVQARNNRGESALLLAAARNRIEYVRTLLAAGADLESVDYDGSTALILIARAANAEHESDYTPTLRLLLEAGADAKAANFNGWTPLMFAARNGTEEIARTLLAAGAEVNARDANGMTSLLFAAGNNRLGTCRLLIEAGADLELGDRNNMGPLMFATAARLPEVVRLLLAAGANAHARAVNGITALELAQTPELRAILTEAQAKGKAAEK